MAKKKSASSQPEKLRQVRQEDIIFTEEMARKLKALKHRKVDLTDPDAPEITCWDNVQIGRHYRPLKKQVTIRIDMDVLEWFKHATKQYQTLINQACREYMIHHIKPAKKPKRKHL